MDRVETLEQVTAAREMPVDQETRVHTALRRQKRLPMREQTELKKREKEADNKIPDPV